MPTLRLLPELEDAIRHIPGVRAASVVTSAQAEPTEVHVLASPGKAAKQVVRDVQSLALARYDIDIDHRIVSVVQIEDEASNGDGPAAATEVAEVTVLLDEPAPTAGPLDADELADDEAAESDDTEAARPAIAAIAVRTSGAEAEAEVWLEFAGEAFSGSAAGPAAAHHRPPPGRPGDAVRPATRCSACPSRSTARPWSRSAATQSRWWSSPSACRGCPPSRSAEARCCVETRLTRWPGRCWTH